MIVSDMEALACARYASPLAIESAVLDMAGMLRLIPDAFLFLSAVRRQAYELNRVPERLIRELDGEAWSRERRRRRVFTLEITG